MKRTGCLIFLMISLTVSAQNIAVTDTLIRFGVTKKGKPHGEKTEIKISKEGGSLQSSDGKVELIFPAGAVTKKTTISIQPVTNHAPNSGDKAYQMEPSGINFQQPVQIIFHYRDEDTEGSMAGLMSIAMQDDKGLWSPLDKVELDTISKTMKSTISHFSSYVNYARSKLYPASARVKINGSLRLQIKTLIALDEVDDEISPLGGSNVKHPETWSVNAIEKGNSSIGFISASQNNSAIYQAPVQVPQQNPVAVSVEHIYNLRGVKKNIIRLVSNILVYGDAWQVNMTANIKGGSKESWGGFVTYNDEGSFILSLEKNKPAVIGIKNHLEDLINNCSKIILNPTTCTGLIHIAGIRSIKVSPANPPTQPNPIVEVWFVPHPTELTRYKFTCPPPPGTDGAALGTIDLSKMITMMMYGQPAIPSYIKFEAKDGELVLVEKGKPGSEMYYKIWVTKIKD